MVVSVRSLLPLMFVSAVMLAAPAVGLAAPAAQVSSVGGVVGSELVLSVPEASELGPQLTHAAASSVISPVQVTSTSAHWTLSVKDDAPVNPGHLTRDGGGGAPLARALEWASDGAEFSELSGVDATVKSSAGAGTVTVTYRQALDATDHVAAGDRYALTAVYTLVG